ncbi:MAG: ATP-dependent helicase [Candidatus Sumerlaeia bacterium]
MTITDQELIIGIEAKNGFPLDLAQKQAICYGTGPLLIAAGPGTGKTEVLVARCLKFMCCDGVAPGSIILTTFTEKAAKNLQDRLSEAFLSLVARYPQLSTIDPSDLRIGTLHGLCNDILQEYRYTAYQNLRLLDEVESALLIHKHVVGNIQPLQRSLFGQFNYLFGNKPENCLNKWDWSLALQKIFNRLIEDRVDLNRLQQASGPWTALQQADAIYEQALTTAHSCDFSRLLRYFRTFLDTTQGDVFMTGDGSGVRIPLTHVLVDEYQDTNPIQESIYLRLCDSSPHNITVVGDDDQALYRFRGGTVECMVGFPSACHANWGINPQVIYLADNHRSDSNIVQWCSDYIRGFPKMAAPNVRIPGKPPLNSSLGRTGTGTHHAVGLIRTTRVDTCATSLANLVMGLRANRIIQDYSQCVLLLRSTKNSPHFAGPYVTAFQAQNIPVYNPRSRDFLEHDEVTQCLGAFIRIIDPQMTQVGLLRSPAIQQLVQAWVANYDAITTLNTRLADYVTRGAQEIAGMAANERITPAMPTILYRILAHEPFTRYQNDPEMDLRLSKLTRLFESFCSQYGRELWTDNANAGQLPNWWYGNFYYGLCGYLDEKGLDDDEDEDVVCPTGFFPIMTVHQAKGLQFDFVFVGNLGATVSTGNAHQLENDLRRYRSNPPSVVHPIADAQWHDEIRQHFVAYSRAKFALVLVATDSQLRKSSTQTASFGHQGGGWVRQNIPRL